MNIKRIMALALALIMVLACMSALLTVSAEETDKFAPANEELTQMYGGEKGDALGACGTGESFGAKITVPEGKRLTQINFPFLATYSNNVNTIVFRVTYIS